MVWRSTLRIDGPMPLWILAPGYLLGITAGALLFRHINERRFRQAALGILIIVSGVALLA